MVDIVDPGTRSKMMAGIQGKNTKPELIVRRAVHRRGFRYRLHVRGLPGKPDMVFPSRKAVIFIHGCFWHGHDCHLFRWPTTRESFWKDKITGNRQNDISCVSALAEKGWRILTIWECALKGKTRLPEEKVIEAVVKWLQQGNGNMEIRGE